MARRGPLNTMRQDLTTLCIFYPPSQRSWGKQKNQVCSRYNGIYQESAQGCTCPESSTNTVVYTIGKRSVLPEDIALQQKLSQIRIIAGQRCIILLEPSALALTQHQHSGLFEMNEAAVWFFFFHMQCKCWSGHTTLSLFLMFTYQRMYEGKTILIRSHRHTDPKLALPSL